MPTPRTVNDIIPPSRRRKMVDAAAPEPVDPVAPPVMDDMPPAMPPNEPPMTTHHSFEPSRRRFPWGTGAVALVVILASVGALWLFSGAKVEVTPRVDSGTVSAEFTATPESGELPYRVVTAEKIAEKSVAAESTVNANDAAQGTITVYNTSAAPQRFVKNTRFESPQGLIFRAQDAVNIPAGSAGSPGSVKVAVFAETGGEKYNIAPTDFTLPGLEGTVEFKQVYGKSTETFAGGFLGNRPSVSEATATRERQGLESALQSEIQDALRAAAPEGYILVPGSEVVTYAPLPDSPDGKGGVNVRHRATASAAAFPAEEFARAVAQSVIGQGYTGQRVRLENVDQLRITPVEAFTGTDPFVFTLTGAARIVWVVDANRIAASVAGKTRDSARVMISGLPEVGSGTITLKPFWKGTLPSDPEEIEVVVSEPEK